MCAALERGKFTKSLSRAEEVWKAETSAVKTWTGLGTHTRLGTPGVYIRRRHRTTAAADSDAHFGQANYLPYEHLIRTQQVLLAFWKEATWRLWCVYNRWKCFFSVHFIMTWPRTVDVYYVLSYSVASLRPGCTRGPLNLWTVVSGGL